MTRTLIVVPVVLALVLGLTSCGGGDAVPDRAPAGEGSEGSEDSIDHVDKEDSVDHVDHVDSEDTGKDD